MAASTFGNETEQVGMKMRAIACAFAILVAVSIAAPLGAGEGKLVHVVKLTDYEEGSIDNWLLGKGFRFEQDAKKRNRIDLDVGDNGLVLEAKRKAFGLMVNESVNVPEFTYVEVDWGVTKFPEGASYEQGVRNEAIMVMIFMGDEKQPSGSIFVPNSPYFVGLYLCHDDDKINHPYVGAHFKKGGRYVCGDQPKEGELVTTRFNLLEAYRSYFDKEGDDDPAVSGIALALDTKKADGGGKSSAFVREIRFYR